MNRSLFLLPLFLLPLMLLTLLVGCSSQSASPEQESTRAPSARGLLTLSETALRNARLTVVALTVEPITGSTIVPARVALDPRREAVISAITGGQVDRILVRPGDPVAVGTPLATVLSPDLGEAIGLHLAASARLDAAQARRDRLERLLADGVSAKAQVLQAEAELTVAAAEAEAAEERLRVFGVATEDVRPQEGEHFSSRFPVKSPIAGEVLSTNVTAGKAVEPGEMLFHVGDLDEVWMVLDVYERDLAAVAVGASVSFSVDAYVGETFDGEVDQVGGWLDPDARTIEVRVIMPNQDHRLKPNMFAKARLALAGGGAAQGFVVPGDAVQAVDEKPAVFIEVRPGSYELRSVRFERLVDGRVQLLDGVEVGDRVVTDGAFTLKSELAKGELEGE